MSFIQFVPAEPKARSKRRSGAAAGDAFGNKEAAISGRMPTTIPRGVCVYTGNSHVESNRHGVYPDLSGLNNGYVNRRLRGKIPRLWRIACLSEFIITNPDIISGLTEQPLPRANEHARLMAIEAKLDRTDLASRNVRLNINEREQQAGLLSEQDAEFSDTFDLFKDVEFSSVEDGDDDCAVAKTCESGVCFSWRGRVRQRLNTRSGLTYNERNFTQGSISCKYGPKTGQLAYVLDKRLQGVRLNELDVPSVWIPSIRKRNAEGLEKIHTLNLTHENELGQCRKFATIVVVRLDELPWFVANYANNNTFFVAIDRPGQPGLQRWCVGDAKHFAFCMAKELGCNRIVLMDDGVHGFEHNSIVSFNPDGSMHAGKSRIRRKDLVQVDMTRKRNQRFPITWSTAFKTMAATMDETNAAIIASDTKPHSLDGSHCSEFINRFSESGKLPNQVWMINVRQISQRLNRNVPVQHHIAAPIHPAYQAGEDVLMNMVLFQRGFRVETIVSIRHRKWAGGTCSVSNGERWNPFVPLEKYRDMYRMIDTRHLYGSVVKARPSRNKPRQKEGRAAEQYSDFAWPETNTPLLNYRMKQPARGLHEQPQQLLVSVVVSGVRYRPSEPIISCVRKGNSRFNVLHQMFSLKGYGLRWWHTMVSIDAMRTRVTFQSAEPLKGGESKDQLTDFIQIQPVAGSKQKPIPYVAMYKGKSVFAKKYPSESAAIKHSAFQLYIDGLKERFDIIPMHLRRIGMWLIGDDLGAGKNYQRGEDGMLVKELSGAPRLQTYQEKLDDNGLDSTIRILLFRAVFNVSDTHFKNIVWSERLQSSVSVDETGERTHDLLSNKTAKGWPFFWFAMSGTQKRMKCMSVKTKERIQQRIRETKQMWCEMLKTWTIICAALPNKSAQRCQKLLTTISSL